MILEREDGTMTSTGTRTQIHVRFPVMLLEGIPTSDGLIITGRIERIEVPVLPVSLMRTTPVGGPELIGAIHDVTRTPGPLTTNRSGQSFPEGTFVWSGAGVVIGYPREDVQEMINELSPAGDLSVVEIVDLNEAERDAFAAGNRNMEIRAGDLCAVTLSPHAAFADAYWELAPEGLRS